MNSEYDRKFDEMKKYIPFLENMIRRLESTGSPTSNPRQAQLDKIKSLRDLLLDKKKRMKMENLLKCEQVLVNLYAKVEQKETLPGISKQVPAPLQQDANKSDLELVRNKLKVVAMQERSAETLPEIARASETEVVCTQGSKEPALFQRRPNKASVSPRHSINSSPTNLSRSPSKHMNKRNYTRVLVSPEPSSRRWSSADHETDDKPLFLKRSPRRSPRRHSPFVHKKERKKFSKDRDFLKQRDLNITLKVPEDSLASLNTKDIMSRIMNCNESDVDIDTLRELRSQIIGELKHTGSQDDISDLILKSYKHKRKSKKKQKGEIEEGELSDSESEIIGNIYSNLKIVKQGSLTSPSKNEGNDSAQRKIQICLVFNSENETKGLENCTKDESELEMFTESNPVSIELSKEVATQEQKVTQLKEVTTQEQKVTQVKEQLPKELLPNKDVQKQSDDNVKKDAKNDSTIIGDKFEVCKESEQHEKEHEKISSDVTNESGSGFKANFYKPMLESECEKISLHRSDKSNEIPLIGIQTTPKELSNENNQNIIDVPSTEGLIQQNKDETNGKKNCHSTTGVVSQIEILQALKNDILSETLSIPGTETSTTPALHQPKITKVASAQEIMAKKRISIEKYKAKSNSKPNSLFMKKTQKDDCKKLSLKLTEKECERFNLDKIAFDDSSDDDLKNEPNLTEADIYSDLAPQSPDNHDKTASDSTLPVIIPENPLKTTNSTVNADIDMRRIPLLSPPPNIPLHSPHAANSANDNVLPKPIEANKNKTLLVDPRVRRDLNRSDSKESPNPHVNPDKTPRPSMTPSYPNMTPSRTPNSFSFEMTPSRNFSDDETPNRKHVYAPLFSSQDPQRLKEIVNSDTDKEKVCQSYSPLLDCPPTPSHPFGRNDAPLQSSHSFGRNEPPRTPSHPFGRNDPPMTSGIHFGRNDQPMTPSHPFGRTEPPRTPTHPFGRNDAPMTPSHPFGRNEIPLTTSHHFGRKEANSSHVFGRNDSAHSQSFGRNDPRLYRSNVEVERRFYERGRYQRDIVESEREHRWEDIDRNERDLSFEHRGRPFHREGYMPPHRQSRRDYESDRLFSRRGDTFYSDNHFECDQRRRGPPSRDRPSNISRAPSVSQVRERAPSIGRNLTTETRETITPRTGRSFNIDTSISTTFQTNFDPARFDERRRRAASVGRTFDRSFIRDSSIGRQNDFNLRRQRASSVGRSLNKDFPVSDRIPDPHCSKKLNFQRASSMGRDINIKNQDKSLLEIKADFASYKLKEFSQRREAIRKNETNKKEINVPKNFNYRDSWPRKEDKHKQSKSINYSPRKNKRDPRMRKEYSQEKGSHKSGREGYKEGKAFGIVYSSDNIAQGRIMGPGYGVKNYKIPKLKRPVEEIKEKETSILEVDNKQESRDSSIEKSKKLDKKDKLNKDVLKEEPKESKSIKKIDLDKKKKTKKKNEETFSDVSYNSESDTVSDRVTRLKSKTVLESNLSETDSPTRKRRAKRAVIYDDSAESDSDQKKEKTTNENIKKASPKSSPKPSPRKDNLIPTKVALVTEESLDDSFGIDDLDVFSGNIVSDPVLSNIDALIADLDNDLTSSKNTTDIAADNLFNTICNSANLQNSEQNEERFTELTSFIEEQLTKNETSKPLPKEPTNTGKCENSEPVTASKKRNDENKDILENSEASLQCNIAEVASKQLDDKQGQHDNKSVEILDSVALSSDRTVSTSESPKKIEVTKIVDSSAPDSTINLNQSFGEVAQNDDRLPDSTNEISNDHTDITSTLEISSVEKEKEKVNPSSNSSNFDSIGNLLNILQDKDKIKQLLSMLGDQEGKNEKIKKKLEKLSEIVESDDEDTKNDDSLINKNQENQNELPLQDESSESINNKAAVDNSLEKTLVEEEKTEDEFSSTETLKRQKSQDNELNVDKQDVMNQEHPLENINSTEPKNKKKVRKNQISKKEKGKSSPNLNNVKKRITRANTKVKPGRTAKTELQKLQEDIKDMFLKTDILNTSGIRMCRLAKMVEDKNSENKHIYDDLPAKENEPLKETTLNKSLTVEKPLRKKPGPKPKVKDPSNDNKVKLPDKVQHSSTHKPGPKSKTKHAQRPEDSDPYAFNTDSANTSLATTDLKSDTTSSESEDESVASSSICSTEPLGEVKKKTKRKRGRRWQLGITKPKTKKNKPNLKHTSERESKSTDISIDDDQQWHDRSIPDLDCFTDKKYCFLKDIETYPCRLCHYIGHDIVHHYKTDHPHSEVPLSRMHPDVAQEAINQCEKVNFQAISKMPTEKYVCRFCFKVFGGNKNVLERFFWHIVSTHTGEYKNVCSECVNMTTCPMNLDIIPPPKDSKGQLIGYICQKCNYTQISLENLKHHVISRHDDEQTEVYTINLADMSNEMIDALILKCNQQMKTEERQLRSSRSNVSLTEASDDHSDNENSDQDVVTPNIPKRRVTRQSIQSKISFENDDTSVISSGSSRIKTEPSYKDVEEPIPTTSNNVTLSPASTETPVEKSSISEKATLNDVVDYPHFKINFNEAGNKEYVCCINGSEYHYKTSLLISMKKHIQLKHRENWDGYCFICRVIVTPQGQHLFKDCFQHCLDQHIDSFPIMEKPVEDITEDPAVISDSQSVTSEPTPVRSYINVRPLSELLSSANEITEDIQADPLPKIESVVSLGSPATPFTVEPPKVSPSFQFRSPAAEAPFVPSKYEEAQAEIMSKKHQVVLEPMMTPEKLARIFKCAGRFCSFTTDSADEALMHATTHQRVGGENALKCAYCDFDSLNNAIDLVMHIFKTHATCQFLCSQCFYRAGASQLVGAHIERFHNQQVTAGSVLKTKLLASTVTSDTSGLLPREVAVPPYVCNNDPQNCKFRTSTPGKFADHLNQKHQADSTFSCFLCPEKVTSAIALVNNHLKVHGLKRYQCTWCFFGADNEHDLLSHASEKHPSKHPQAYLRIITKKEGTSELRTLPLAYLNRTKVPFQEITPSNVTENPVKEAERSIELEKLIGSLITDQLFSKPTTTQPPVEPVGEADSFGLLDSSVATEDETLNFSLEESAEVEENVVPLVDVIPAAVDETAAVVQEPPPLPARLTPPPPYTAPIEPTDTVRRAQTPILKTEAVAPTLPQPMSSAIICLDSDDETTNDANPPVNNAPQKSLQMKVPHDKLYTCHKCKRTCKTAAAFQKHVLACYDNPYAATLMQCAYCPDYTATNSKELCAHLAKNHVMKDLYLCSICGSNPKTLAAMKKHMKDAHKVDRVSVTVSVSDGHVVHRSEPVEPPPPPACDMYHPRDAHLLPINPIFDSEAKCAECGFGTKVRLNMVRHLQQHAQQRPAAASAPVNPVPVSSERYFDKMLNLASSSIASQRAAGRYPRHVEERTRRACGAPGCAYISADDAMLRRHWDTLHAGAANYRCVHCPPSQQLDTSQPLTAARILAHLRMHDAALYACSACAYYHYRRRAVERHAADQHAGAARVAVVREPPPAPAAASPAAAPAPAPTMDLKPWQCGVCDFRSMLRQQVAEHCAHSHQARMQYKCGDCPFRASTLDNVTKHRANSHPASREDIFYFYYREGSIEDDADGTPRWKKQRQKMGIVDADDVKTEAPSDGAATVEIFTHLKKSSINSASGAPAKDTAALVDVPKIKSEPVEQTDLIAKFGQFCEPNGLRYKCPLCKAINEDTMEAMQSHLFEELKYRRWSCSICSYKAFHKNGLHDHMKTEHRNDASREPLLLPVDTDIEQWVSKLLDHQTKLISRNREKLTLQSISTPTPSISSTPEKEVQNPTIESHKYDPKQLEETFGSFGAPVNMEFACPKCQFTCKDEAVMQNHLEGELSKIRWSCSSCAEKFVSYHEAQFHCKVHREGARPREVSREPAARAAWLQRALRAQRDQLRAQPPGPRAERAQPPDDDSLLAVRFEETVPTPEEESLARKRPAPADTPDPADPAPAAAGDASCPHCDFTPHPHFVRDHVLRHYNLKPFSCGYCDYTGHRKPVQLHCTKYHPSMPRSIKPVQIPEGPPPITKLKVYNNKKLAPASPMEEKSLCLICEQLFTEVEAAKHSHPNEGDHFAKKNDVVVKCCICTRLRKDVPTIQAHSAAEHRDMPLNYVYFKLSTLLREFLVCAHCKNVFNTLKDLLGHHHLVHKNLQVSYTSQPIPPPTDVSLKRKSEEIGSGPEPKRTARKSTTKLPARGMTARKSTAKLPQFVYDDSEDFSPVPESAYGTKPSLSDYENVTALMPFCNNLMPFTLKQLRGIIKIEPIVLVKDCKKN